MKTKTIPTSAIPTLNMAGCYENISRAYEIAQIGGHSISLAYYKSVDGDYERDVNPKDCEAVANTYGFNTALDGDLIIEVVRVQFDYLISQRKFETLEEINERIAAAKSRPEVTQIEKLDVCLSLLKIAYERLNLCTTDVQIIFRVAATIARLGLCEAIMVEHIAEAIQYRSIQKHETVKIYEPT
jgi:hypothetical protein